MKAIYRHGNAGKIDYTPSSNVSAGDVIVHGDGVVIAHIDNEANILGAVSDGGGVYSVPKASGEGLTFTRGQDVYFDPTANDGAGEITDDPQDTKYFGKAIEAAGDTDSTFRVRHLQPTPEAVESV